MLESYRPSGRCTVMILPMTVALMVALVAAGWVYQLIVDWIPLIFLTFLATFGFGALIAAATGIMIRYARCRNVAAAVLCGMFAAFIATAATHYFAYVRYTDAMAEALGAEGMVITFEDDEGKEQTLTLTGAGIREQMSLPEYMEHRVEEGWSIGRATSSDEGGGAPISGVWVWLIWLIEAGVLIGAAGMGALAAVKKPYCETCQNWADEDLHTVALNAPPEESLRAVSAATTLDELFNVPVDAPASNASLHYRLAGCPQCEAAYLTVTKQEIVTNKKGETETKKTDLFSGILLQSADVDRLHDLGVRKDEAAQRRRAERQGLAPGSAAASSGGTAVDDEPLAMEGDDDTANPQPS